MPCVQIVVEFFSNQNFLIRHSANVTKHHATAGQAFESNVIVKRLKKKKVLFIGNRLLQIDLTIMEAFITKEIRTYVPVSTLSCAKKLQMHLKSKGLQSVLNCYLSTFCQLYKECSIGGEQLIFFLSGISKLPV